MFTFRGDCYTMYLFPDKLLQIVRNAERVVFFAVMAVLDGFLTCSLADYQSPLPSPPLMFIFILTHIGVFVCIHVCAPCMCTVLRGQKGVLDPLKLELQTLVSCTWVLKMKPGSSAREASDVNVWTSLQPFLVSFCSINALCVFTKHGPVFLCFKSSKHSYTALLYFLGTQVLPR